MSLNAMKAIAEDERLQRRIEELNRTRAEAENATAVAQQTRKSAEEFLRESETIHVSNTAKLAAQKREHDASASRAQELIDAQKEQADNLLRLKAALDERAADLDKREYALRQLAAQVAQNKRNIVERHKLLSAREKLHETKTKKLNDAING
jgi:hypothetical protein